MSNRTIQMTDRLYDYLLAVSSREHPVLARLRDASPIDVADYFATRGHFPKLTFTAHRFVLYSSRASVGGGPYVVEAAYPLG